MSATTAELKEPKGLPVYGKQSVAPAVGCGQ